MNDEETRRNERDDQSSAPVDQPNSPAAQPSDDRFAAELEAIDNAIADEQTVDAIPNAAPALRGAHKVLNLLERMRKQSAESGDESSADDQIDRTQDFAGTKLVGLRPLDPIEIGNYEILNEIARGGMGVVFRARHTELDRVVALKMMIAGPLADHSEKQRFRIEAEAAAQLDHPGIVPIFEVGEYHGQPFFTMGYIDGESLAARISREPLEPVAAAELARRIADAVQYAHQRGVVHRDIKPLNVLIDSRGQPRVTDFGLARRVESDSNLTGTGQVLGTPSYMAPEQAAGQVDAVGQPADVYAIGATLYCMVTGRPPFQAANVIDTIRLVVEQEPASPQQINPIIPVDLATICLKCLHKDPRRRYASASDLADDLTRFLGHQPILARPIGPIERATKWIRRNPAVAGLATAIGLSILALIVGGAWYQVRLASSLAETELERDNVRDEQARATQLLYHSLTSEADFLNQVRPPGFGARVWSSVDQARRLNTPDTDMAHLRQLAVSSLGQLSFDEPQVFSDLGEQVSAADVTPDGRILFVGMNNGDVLIFDLHTDRQIHRFEHHAEPVMAIRVVDNDQVVTLGPFCREAYVWTRQTDDPEGWIAAGKMDIKPSPKMFDLRFAPGGQFVIGWTGMPREVIEEVKAIVWSEQITGGDSNTIGSMKAEMTPTPFDSRFGRCRGPQTSRVSRLFSIRVCRRRQSTDFATPISQRHIAGIREGITRLRFTTSTHGRSIGQSSRVAEASVPLQLVETRGFLRWRDT